MLLVVVFFQAEDGIRDLVRSRGLGDVYKRQVSPLLTLEPLLLKLTTSALNRFSASSKLTRVRVLLSKKRLAMVISRNDGTFFIGLPSTSLKPSAVRKINSCLLYTSDAADERSSVDLGGRRLLKKQTQLQVEAR